MSLHVNKNVSNQIPSLDMIDSGYVLKLIDVCTNLLQLLVVFLTRVFPIYYIRADQDAPQLGKVGIIYY